MSILIIIVITTTKRGVLFLEVVQDANEKLLQDQEKYFFYVLEQTENIIQDYGIQYNAVKDDRKTYPKFTNKQFSLILRAIHTRVYKSNRMLLYNNIYSFRYDISKVELCYVVFNQLCLYYNITPNIETFILFSGVSKSLMIEWLNTGKSTLYRQILDDTNNIDNFLMLNSDNSLLRMYYRNHQQIERLEEQNSDILPDLLQIEQTKNLSLQDGLNNLQPFSHNLLEKGSSEKETKNA